MKSNDTSNDKKSEERKSRTLQDVINQSDERSLEEILCGELKGSNKRRNNEEQFKNESSTKGINRQKHFGIKVAIVIIFVIGISIFMIIQNSSYKKSNKIYDTIDPTLVVYENSIDKVTKIKYLYEIYNNETYKTAKRETNLTPNLASVFFPTEEFTGTTEFKEKPSVEIWSVQYEIGESTSEMTYFIVLVRTNTLTKESAKYNIIVKLTNGVISKIQGF